MFGRKKDPASTPEPPRSDSMAAAGRIADVVFDGLVKPLNEVDPSVDQAAMARIMVESAIAMSKLRVTPAELGQTAD